MAEKPATGILNIYSRAKDWRSKLLSNFAATPFDFTGVSGAVYRFASVEGFWQGVKFKESDPRQKEAFALTGKEALSLGRTADFKGIMYFDGAAFSRESIEWQKLLERVVRAKFIGNEEARNALLATESMRFTHIIRGKDRTGFVEALLAEIRKEVRECGEISRNAIFTERILSIEKRMNGHIMNNLA